FMGGFLPAESNLSDKGFTAHWSVYSFNRGFPQQWTTASPSLPRGALQSSEFGVDLLTTVNTYQQNSRSLKYAMLFLLLTFTSYFLFEVLSKMRIHPLQYLFVGFAMCVFYLLLLSMSEHIAFLSSYLISSAATVVLISLYSVWVLRGKLRALLMAFLLTFIYGYLYVLLQLQDYALLIGSLSLFVVLALVMFLTRKLDWYEVTVNEGK
ncbi:MAG: inner membrane CreD family protein, partial [bacterium]|nr:inner membrane CreD family protein [bacterium]